MSGDEDGRAVDDAYALVFDGLELLGPTTTDTRRRVLESLRAALPAAPVVVDMGCGAGVASRFLAAALPDARIVALDLHAGFLARVRGAARDAGLRLLALRADMGRAPLAPGSVDLIWSESAIYGVGRVAALEAWRPLLRPGGRVAFSDVVWTGVEPPAWVRSFWAREYPAMTSAAGVEADARVAGYRTELRLDAPATDWQAYYAPLRPRVEQLAPAAGGALAEVLAVMREELEVFDAHGECAASNWFVVRPT